MRLIVNHRQLGVDRSRFQSYQLDNRLKLISIFGPLGYYFKLEAMKPCIYVSIAARQLRSIQI